MNNRHKLIEKLSYHQYEPILFSEFNNSQLTSESLCYKKAIFIDDTKIEYFLIFSNVTLLEMPKVYITESQLTSLQEKFTHIQQPIPHLQKRKIKYLNNELYYVCYFMENSRVIPRNDLDKLILMIEQYLMDFFIKLLNKNQYIQEYQTDFLGTIISLSDLTNDKSLSWHIVKNEEVYQFWNSKGKNEIFCLNIDSKKVPNFLGLVKNNQVTIQSFLNFVLDWDNESYLNLNVYLNQLNKHKKKQPVNILIDWKDKLMGVSFEWNDCQNKLVKNFLNERNLTEKVIFHTINLIDFKSSILRNLPTKSQGGLLNKKIFQIGLGAIGGYIADSLIKIGAGIENELAIIDSDYFSIDNVGRHLLGIGYIGNSKAKAFQKYVQRQSFDTLKKLNCKLDNISNYSYQYFIDNPMDLIVDATGSIEVQEYLNDLVQKIPLEYRPNLLHLWILGNGECMQGFWLDSQSQNNRSGCIQCLGTSDNGLSEKYLPIKNSETEQRFGACSAFTPYAVSGGMMASSLGINMILEWLETGAIKHNYQTRYNSKYQDEKINDMFIVANKDCPNCGEKYAKSI